MKFQKLFLSAATVCLVVGVSGAAMAQVVIGDCPDGFIQGTEDAPLEVESIVLNGVDCVIKDVVVVFDATITNSQSLSFIDNNVGGDVLIRGSRWATIIGNTVENNLRVTGNELVGVYLNIVANVLAVNRNVHAEVKKNAALTLICRGNIVLDENRNEALNERCGRLNLF